MALLFRAEFVDLTAGVPLADHDAVAQVTLHNVEGALVFFASSHIDVIARDAENFLAGPAPASCSPWG